MGGYVWVHVNWTYISTILGNQIPLLGVIWLNVSLTQRLTKASPNIHHHGYIWAGYVWLQMSSWPDVVLLLVTRCHYQWGTSDCRSVWPKGSPNVKLNWCSTALGHEMLLLGGYIWLKVSLTKGSPNVKLTWCNTALGHQMPLPGVHLTAGQPDPKAHQMSSWPDVVLLMATRCFYWGYVWPTWWHTLWKPFSVICLLDCRLTLSASSITD